jgi:hypothetical protein
MGREIVYERSRAQVESELKRENDFKDFRRR